MESDTAYTDFCKLKKMIAKYDGNGDCTNVAKPPSNGYNISHPFNGSAINNMIAEQRRKAKKARVQREKKRWSNAER